MSLKYRDKNGALTVLAGLTPGGNLEAGAVATRKGTTSVPSTSADSDVTVSVAFTDAMPDEDYEVNLHATADFIIGRISNQTANGFTVTLRNAKSSSSSGNLDWYAFKTYSVAHAEQNASDIADIKTKIPSTASSSNKLATSNELSSLGTAIDGRLDALEDTIPSSASLQNQLITETGLTTALQGKQDTLTFDDTPTEDSSNPVTSDGIKDAIDDTAADIYEVMGKNGAKNLLPNNAATKTVNGITFTVNSDGSVTANGTATSNSYIILTSSFNLVGGEYILSDEANSTDGDVQMILDTPDGAQRFAACYGATREKKFTLNQAYTLRSFIWIGSGITVDNVTFKPMIRLATDTDSTYQPYAMTNQQMTSYVQAISNPNLLDNPWFTVNQRGFTTTTASEYTVDRWKKTGTVGNVSLDSDGCVNVYNDSTGSSWTNFQQVLDEQLKTALQGKTCTLSVMLKDGTIKSSTGVPDFTQNSSYCAVNLIDNIYIVVRSVPPALGTVQIAVSPNTAQGRVPSIRAVKLELGSVSTLAMDTAPNYATELLKCQRYFVRFLKQNNSTSPIAYGATENDNSLRAGLPLPTTLRTESPTISVSDLTKTRIYCNNNSYTPTNITQYKCMGHILHIKIDAASLPSYTAGAFMFGTSGNYLDVSADL